MQIRIIYLMVFVLFTATFAQNGKTYTIEKENGFEIVHNKKPLWGDKPKIALEKVLEIGGIDDENENHVFALIGAAIIDSRGNYIISDSKKNCLHLFTANGSFIGRAGRAGNGPGEFTVLVNLMIDSKENLLGYDTFARKINIFSTIYPKNNILPFIKSVKKVEFIYTLKSFKNGNILIGVNNNSPVAWKDKNQFRCLIVNEKFEKLKEFLNYNKPPLARAITLFYDQFNAVIDSYGNIFVGEACINRFEKYSIDGKLLFAFDRLLPYKMEYYTDNKAGISYSASIKNLCIDNKNRIWASSYKSFYTRDELIESFTKRKPKRKLDMQFEVYNDSGQLLSLYDPFGKQDLFMLNICGDKMLLTDRDGVTFFVYKIIEK